MKLSLIFAALVAALSSANALAADANITFNGTVSANTCTLAAADATKILTIPSVASATLYAASTGSNYTTYTASGSFGFSACPAGLTKITSNYTYQGALTNGTTDAVAVGTALNIVMLIMQSSTPSTAAVVNVNGTSSTNNQTSIVSNAATVPVSVGILSKSSSGTLTLPTVGTYTGTYLVAFTYS